jgi:hypothetical protein
MSLFSTKVTSALNKIKEAATQINELPVKAGEAVQIASVAKNVIENSPDTSVKEAINKGVDYVKTDNLIDDKVKSGEISEEEGKTLKEETKLAIIKNSISNVSEKAKDILTQANVQIKLQLKKISTLGWVAIGVGTLAVVGGIILFIKMKK